MGFLKFLGGVVLAIVGFFMMAFAVLGFFMAKITELLQGTPLASWPLIVIGIIGFFMFLGGVYILRPNS
jgi:uncharacterized membrane protein